MRYSPRLALRSALKFLLPVAVLHLLGGSVAVLGQEALVGAAMLIAVMQPVTALLLFLAGQKIRASLPTQGKLISTLAILYACAGLLPLFAGPVGFIVGFLAAAFMGPLIGASVFAILAWALVRARPSGAALDWRKWGVALVFPVLGVLSWAIATANNDAAMYLWVLMPQVATAAAVFWLFKTTQTQPDELELMDAIDALPPFELVEDTLPIGVQCRLPLGEITFERASGQQTRLGNPVLDGLVPLNAADPEKLALTLRGHEATVLSVLHAWPLSELEGNTLIWRATLSDLHEKDHTTAHSLAQIHEELLRFQALFLDGEE